MWPAVCLLHIIKGFNVVKQTRVTRFRRRIKMELCCRACLTRCSRCHPLWPSMTQDPMYRWKEFQCCWAGVSVYNPLYPFYAETSMRLKKGIKDGSRSCKSGIELPSQCCQANECVCVIRCIPATQKQIRRRPATTFTASWGRGLWIRYKLQNVWLVQLGDL